jgi:hypothetical protein
MLQPTPIERHVKAVQIAIPGPPQLAPKLAIEDVAARYHDLDRKLVDKVTADHVTPDYIRAVQIADRAARQKLALLESADGGATIGAIQDAKAAVAHLAQVLAQPPDKVGQ